MHSFIHDELDLTDSQLTQLEALEAGFAVKQESLELSLRAANADLATAIEAVHHKMGALQKATVEHIFNMRRLLTDEQQKSI
ncbi:MAG: Spy/CpxP family protein refolding chaperone [Parasphingorhabdus sp.]|uniref:Spy/CpxP family protein refolding chaperone n=1 Tax=Parasphingorhabdus sp. TaxID=2709688 RepID=UPI0030016E32